MKIHHFVVNVVLVLLVTGRVTNGVSENDQVLRLNKNYLNKNLNKNNNTNSNNKSNNNNNNNSNNNGDNDDLFSQVTVDANSVITSTEIQGATPKLERHTLKSSLKKYDLSQLTTTSAAPSTSIEPITKETLNLNNFQSNILPTTSRPRHGPGASPQERDLPLMTLLAARRNALPRKEYRTPHRRITTTSRTSPSSTSVETTSSKSPTNSRSTCERNCTKNFTKRTTASCMRRCASLQRLANATTTTSPPSIKSKVDEKDNNEILLTDESSHGFFVVTKELNDTANHIHVGMKVSQTSTEKSHRNKYKNYRNPSAATLSVEETDLQPYLFFGQKLPPPTVLRINKLNDDHPKILEITVTKPTERVRIPSRRFNTNRNLIGNGRRYSAIVGNLTRSGNIVNTTDAPVDLLIKRNSQSIVKDIPENLTDVITSSSTETIKQEIPSSTTSIPIMLTENNSTTTNINKIITSTSAPITSSIEKELPAPLLINVPEEEETTEIQTSAPQPVPQQQADSNFYIPPDHFEEKPNLIIFVNDTTTPIPTRPTTVTTTTRLPTTSSTTSSTVRPPNVNTSEITFNKLPEIPVTTTPKSFTRTTVSSSVRSTVYPRINPNVNKTVIPTKRPDIIASPSTSTNINIPSLYQPANSDEDDSNELEPRPSSTISNIGIVVENNNSVTIEADRINMATYVLAGLGMFPIVVIILYVTKTILFKRRAKEETDLDGYVTDQQPISPVRQMDDDHNDDYSILSDNEFERKNIRFKSLLGEGNFGQVWKAEADDLSGHMGTTRIVAVKTVRSGGSQVSLKDEADIMKKLGSHTNVVTLLGACVESEPHFLIMEYAMRGRLLSLLRAARSATNILPASVPGGRSLAPLSPRTLAGFALDIARGMEYISEKKIVHRDLAARNILLDHNGVCKICDFGMSIDLESIRKTQIQPTRKADLILNNSNAIENRMKFDFGGRIINHWHIHGFGNNNNNNCNEKKHHDTIGKRPALPIRWMAPEALQYHIFSTESDVWAFGIVLWEIATLGGTPYPNLSGREVVRNVPNGARPDLPKDGRHEFYDLMSRCWIKNPQHRPSFREARSEVSRSICKWVDDDTATSDYMDVSGFSEDLEHGMVYFNQRISEFECEI